MVDHPCWLTKDELAIAFKLLKLGYYYAGNFEEDGDEDEFGETFSFPVIGKIGSWSIFSTGGLGLIAEIRGASYVLVTENPTEFSNRTLMIIKEEIKQQECKNRAEFKQLCLI